MTIIDKLRNDAIFAENEDYRIRNLTDNDREDYIHTLKGVSKIPQIYETEGFEDISWKDATTSDSSLTLAVERKTDHRFVGDCLIKNLDTDRIELGLDIVARYQNQGIGTNVFRLLIMEIHRRFPDKKVITRIYSDNIQSQHLVQKLGAVKIGEEPSEYDSAMAIMSEMNEELGIIMNKEAIILSENHIDVYEL